MRSQKKKPFSKSRIYSKHKVKNWSAYNDCLRKRGRVDFMIAEDLVNAWHQTSGANTLRDPGGQIVYSDIAILRCLEIRCLFGLKLRQTEGFINYLIDSLKLSIRCPDYTTLSKRGKKLGVNYSYKNKAKNLDYVVMDSTGIQTYTGNEWLENKHGKQYQRRIWKKLHILLDDEGGIIANAMTTHNTDDRSPIDKLLQDIKSKEFLGDSGYDGNEVYQLLKTKGMKPIIRPPNRAPPEESGDSKSDRDIEVEYFNENGYEAWRVKNKYGRREKVENTFYRFKTSFGSKFLSKGETNMKNEMTIKCQLLNRMFEIGKPISVRVA